MPTALSNNAIYWLDKIADAYTPILLIIAIVTVTLSWRRGNRVHVAYLLYAVVVVYSLMFADKHWALWESRGLDYSTHSAASFALIVVICWYQSARTWMRAFLSLVGYGGLMHLLNYHSWMDMGTSVLACTLGLLPIALVHIKHRFSKGKSANMISSV